MSASSQALQHDAGHGDVDPSLVRPGESLVALAQAAGVVQPAEGALDGSITLLSYKHDFGVG